MILSHIKQFLYQFWSALICSKGPPCFQPPICSALSVFIKKLPQNVLIHSIQKHPGCATQRGSLLIKLLVWKSIYLSKPVKSSSVRHNLALIFTQECHANEGEIKLHKVVQNVHIVVTYVHSGLILPYQKICNVIL